MSKSKPILVGYFKENVEAMEKGMLYLVKHKDND